MNQQEETKENHIYGSSRTQQDKANSDLWLPSLTLSSPAPPDPIPSIRVTTNADDKVMKMRDGGTKYGGKGDKQHLGKSSL